MEAENAEANDSGGEISPSADHAIPPVVNPSGGTIKICCVGTGFLGVISMLIMCTKCPNIEVYISEPADLLIEDSLIEKWIAGETPIYETGLMDLLAANLNVRLFFSDDLGWCLTNSDVIVVAAEISIEKIRKEYFLKLHEWEKTWRAVAPHAVGKLVIEKSCVPINGLEIIHRILTEEGVDTNGVDIVFNPEFFRLGTAINDMESPKVILFGGPGVRSPLFQHFRNVYPENWIMQDRFILVDDVKTVILVKIALNYMLGLKLVGVNSVASLCAYSHCDVIDVLGIICRFERLGEDYLSPSIGFGGPGLFRDLKYMCCLAENLPMRKEAEFFKKMVDYANEAKINFVKMVIEFMATLKTKEIAILGFAFKKGTSDTRDSPAIDVCRKLLEHGAHLRIHDPHVRRADIHKHFSRGVSVVETPSQATEGADAICILTDWPEYQDDFFNFYSQLYENMRHPSYIFDGRYLDVNWETLRYIGFSVHRWGRKAILVNPVEAHAPGEEHPGEAHTPGEEHPGEAHPDEEHPGEAHPDEEHPVEDDFDEYDSDEDPEWVP